MNNVLGIILARKGSKRLPGKNTKDLLGWPLIDYTVDSALKSKSIDHLIISTDDPKIIKTYKDNLLIEIDIRPDELCGDDITSEAVILELMQRVEKYLYIILLQPTSPQRQPEIINLALLNCKNCLVTKNIENDKWNGMIYISKWDYFLQHKKFVPDSFIMCPEEFAIDIDTIEDFNRARKKMSVNKKKVKK
jgi:CMP-N-acetylneuraminic acid synthetase